MYILKVDNGETFEGTIEQWEDCFFSKPDHLNDQEFLNIVKEFCRIEGWDVEITERKPN